MAINKPNFDYLWASGGAVVEPSDAKKQTGWVSEVPPHQWENWVQNRQDTMLAHINERGIPQWDSSTAYLANRSYVTGSSGTIFRCLQDNSSQNPETDTLGYWEELDRGLQDALELKADKATTITAGTGLTGGGNLSANRTLNVQYGSTAGTAAQGNDARITEAWEQSRSAQFANYNPSRTYTTGEIVRGSDGVFYEFYDRDQSGTTQGQDPTNSANRPHIWMEWDGVRPGSTIEWRSETLPEGYIENDGSEISRADYRRIFSAFGTTYGAGDGETTFGTPDDRGEFKRGWDHGRGVDPGRSLGVHQLDQMQRITGSIDAETNTVENGMASGVFTYGLTGTNTGGRVPVAQALGGSAFALDSANSPNARTSSATDGETRSRNNAVIWLTKI